MAESTLALPVTALLERFNPVIIVTVIVVVECAVLAFNEGRCPRTGLAARFTAKRADNFDIYLPNWLARNNKLIFGILFVVNELFVLWRWAKESQPKILNRENICSSSQLRSVQFVYKSLIHRSRTA